MNHQQSMFGVLNINKPGELTSRDVVNRVQRMLPRKTKCGHAGTLDPIATGVLVVCIGKATQLVPLLHEHAKAYEGKFLLGQQSDTDDIEGELKSVPIPAGIDEQAIRSLLPEFMGEIEQVPPAYSAIKVNGERAYKAARRGDEVNVPPRRVIVDRLELTHFHKPEMTLSLTCGTGTYVRSIGRDIAQRLGTSAVMSELVRTSIGPFQLSESIALDELSRENIQNYVQSPLYAIPQLPRYVASDEEIRRMRFGQKVPAGGEFSTLPMPLARIAVLNSDEQIEAIAKWENERLAPQIVFPTSQ